eukprot:PITA_33117
MKMKAFVLLVLLCFCISPSFSHLWLPTTERVIKELNLIPGIAEPEEENDVGRRLVERSINLNINGDSEKNASLEELGHHAGYFRLKDTHAARVFYFFFESRGSKADDPVVLWMTGGPGCGSEIAVFYENGPFKITDNLTLIWNEYGWDKASNIIFVDQPTGTGFSYNTDRRDLRHDEKGVSNDMYDFIQEFFKEHPKYAKNDLFITGESYGGHYVPAVTSRVHQGNKNNEGLPINLKGFAIGNGLTDPTIQYKAYTDYAFEMGLIREDDYNRINKIYPSCERSIKICGTKGNDTCIASYFTCKSIFDSILALAGNINYYDIRKECNGDLCYGFLNMKYYLNQSSVKDALGVGSQQFGLCSTLVFEYMLADWMRNMEVGIPTLLEDGVKLLVYAGEYDLICNWLGNSRWVNSMDWFGKDNFKKAPIKSFLVDDKEAGLITSYGPLSFLKVHDAGHMVPMDQPKAALEMLKRWTQGSITDNFKF